MNLLPFFTWLEESPIGVFVKDQGATFATIEAFHLMALAMLGGSVLAADLRLLNVVLRDVRQMWSQTTRTSGSRSR